MRILVTGANGYLGQGIVKQLLDNGHKVIATDLSASHIDNRAEKIECDLFSVSDPFVCFKCPDVLLHLAWRNGFVHNSETHINDLPKHYVFLSKMVKGGLKQIAVMGTMHEVGFWEGAVNENTPCHPQSFYGIAKNALREITELLAQEQNIVFQWLRGFYIVGNSQYGCSVFSKITEAVIQGKTEFPFTTGVNQYDFLDYEVFCSQVAAVVEQSEVTGIINICSGRPEKLADRVERFIKDNGFNLKLRYGIYPDRPYDSKAVWGDDRKIRSILEKL